MKLVTVIAAAAGLLSSVVANDHPNIVLILADDMGVGDVSHDGGVAPTPHLDRLADEGMRFTDAHTTSSVCTPSRYGLLTGRYNWRTRLQRSVFFDVRDKPLIKDDESTIGSLLKEAGYSTAIIGKWHLGFEWQFKKSLWREHHLTGKGWDVDYSKPLITAPTANGFDYFYGIMASLDMAPYVYVENNQAVGVPDVTKAFHRPGAATSDFEANECLQVFAEKSVEFINAKAKEGQPFFLYLPLTSPHTPIVPSERWLGKSGIGKYGDFLMETDWVVGQVLAALEKNGVGENTLVLFTADNGCSPAAGIDELVAHGHLPNGKLRGAKADLYEGGHRVPTVVRWPGVVPAGSVTDRLTSLVDVYATFADIVGATPDASDGVDSISFYETLRNPEKGERGVAIVMHSFFGKFAIRHENWKLLFSAGSGGWSRPQHGNEGDPMWQLYDLDADLQESTNLLHEHPNKVKELHAMMIEFIRRGRSTPGAKQANDVEVAVPKVDDDSKKLPPVRMGI
ncbi:sulfatase family protein [Sulfuriroseicoccus oceanibius]|uniref:Arylsulfatase n=1 Tax=Sulfuriroseicoccus oceanibius TaxID=2707525 RepID=A0A6B3L2P1_9BACT|nr:arylsulfatase [Sulfuriroseicoccus oceanibius]QQL43917.1 arylsulfatase [Sulfuriroseicoccus oceanibius]